VFSMTLSDKLSISSSFTSSSSCSVELDLDSIPMRNRPMVDKYVYNPLHLDQVCSSLNSLQSSRYQLMQKIRDEKIEIPGYRTLQDVELF
jgi:hypothetical protein